jgi:competence CoiA-like predicted nuclease
MTLAGFNVTVDPRAPATPVDDPEIVEVIDLVSGAILQAKRFIGSHRYGDLVEARVGMREALKNEQPRHICAICWTPVYLVASTRKRFFFRHKTEDGSCPAITRDPLTEQEIRARKYRGLRESEAHKRIKRLIERSLRADPAFITETIVLEKRWNSEQDPKKWRKPDVQATSGEGRFAFEAQLSTTFLDVVVSRRMFYRDEGAHLVWVLPHFSPDYRRMTTDDLLFSNNSNIFVVDDETVRIAEETKRFHLRCHYRTPVCEGSSVKDVWQEAIVPFTEIRKELDRQRVYYFDYESEENGCKVTLDQNLRDEVVSFWKENVNPRFDGDPEQLKHWEDIRRRLADRNIAIPNYPNNDGSFRNLMHAVLSALAGHAVGWQFETLIQCAHQTAQGHPENLLAFGYAIEVAGHKELLRTQDLTGKWERRSKLIRERVLASDPTYMPRPEWLPALSFLFPEVARRVTDFLKRYGFSKQP